jgi:hypothetical protein
VTEEDAVVWDGHLLRRLRGKPPRRCEDGTVELTAEGEYVLEYAGDDPVPGWRTVSRKIGDALLLIQFGNFIGETAIGEQRLVVVSDRVRPNEVESMLSDIVARLQSLAFGFGAPTSFVYERDVVAKEDVLYQAYVFVRHGIRGVGKHDVTTAMERVLARPHVRLRLEPSHVPVSAARRVDAATIHGIVSGRAALLPVPASSPLAESPVVRALRGRLPEYVDATRAAETTVTPENTFVAGLLSLLEEVVARTKRVVESRGDVGAQGIAEEAGDLQRQISRWRQAPLLRDLTTEHQVPLNSTVLRSRPGYRELTRFYVDLISRSRVIDAADAARILDARDAALIYEYWCFFEVVDAVARVTGRRAGDAEFQFSEFSAALRRSYQATFPEATVAFNKTYAAPTSSYSVTLRPDISVVVHDGGLHLFDAKLRRDVLQESADVDVVEQEEERATFKRGDLYKMHTYRDALNASSVWILYPGRNVETREFAADANAAQPSGVGAIPLLPGDAVTRAGLDAVVDRLLRNDLSVSEA